MKKIYRDFWIVFRKELRELLRDRRSLFWLFAPPFLLPAIAICGVLFIGTQLVRIVDEGIPVTVINAANAPELVEHLENDEIIFIVEDENKAVVTVNVPEGFQEAIENGQTASLEIITQDSSLNSFLASASVRAAVDEYNQILRERRLASFGVDETWLTPIQVGETRRSKEAAVGSSDEDDGPGVIASIFLPLAITSWVIGGGMGLVLDSTVGEKERQTIENILVTPVNRIGVVLGKMTVIFIASLLVMSLWLIEGVILNAISASGDDLANIDSPSTTEVIQTLFDNSSGIVGIVLAILVMIIPFTVMLNALVMAWCAYASNYREANLFMALIQLGLPAVVLLAAFSIPADVSIGIYAMPLLGTIVSIRDLFSATLSFPELMVNIISTSAYAIFAITLAAWVFGREWSLTRGLQ
ncbi:MAG: hypothetical protein CUN55_07430 [Phototrophicales bacterium]|nr:MAG: hypothetical protein CUN55_07430 [Phototrophicales bacterium]